MIEYIQVKKFKGIKMFSTQMNKMDMDMRRDHHDDRRITIAFCFGEVNS